MLQVVICMLGFFGVDFFLCVVDGDYVGFGQFYCFFGDIVGNYLVRMVFVDGLLLYFVDFIYWGVGCDVQNVIGVYFCVGYKLCFEFVKLVFIKVKDF